MSTGIARTKSSASSGSFEGPLGNTRAATKTAGSVIELLAEELHRQYRAAEKALNKQTHSLYRAGVLLPNENRLLHDHGWTACGKQEYFRKRAALMVKRATDSSTQTLGEAEASLSAALLILHSL
jgi:hypothetical protein